MINSFLKQAIETLSPRNWKNIQQVEKAVLNRERCARLMFKYLKLQLILCSLLIGFAPRFTYATPSWCRDILTPEVKSPLPGPRAVSILVQQRGVESTAVSYPRRVPLVPAEAHGPWVTDVDRNRFLDCFTMAGALPFGHGPEELMSIFHQASLGLMSTLDFPTDHRIKFLTNLQKAAQLSLGFDSPPILHLTGPTGADAVEAALKLARYHTKHDVIIAFKGSYHGMTAGANAVTSGESSVSWRFPRQQSRFAPFPDASKCNSEACLRSMTEWHLNEVREILLHQQNIKAPVAAAIIEPVQGEGGSVVPPPDFLPQLLDLMHQFGALLIADEVQSGFGRVGTFFASESFKLQPDIAVFSKAASGIGAPLAGIIFQHQLNGWPPGSSIGTFRGFDPALASGAKAIDILSDPNFLASVQEKGQALREKLSQGLHTLPWIGKVRGLGLMIGIEIINPDTQKPDPQRALRYMQSAFRKGLLVEIGGADNNVIRLLPPLNIDLQILMNGADILISSLKEKEP